MVLQKSLSSGLSISITDLSSGCGAPVGCILMLSLSEERHDEVGSDGYGTVDCLDIVCFGLEWEDVFRRFFMDIPAVRYRPENLQGTE